MLKGCRVDLGMYEADCMRVFLKVNTNVMVFVDDKGGEENIRARDRAGEYSSCKVVVATNLGYNTIDHYNLSGCYILKTIKQDCSKG